MANTPEWALARIREAREKQLKALDLSPKYSTPDSERLTAIPAEVFELEGLKELDLADNRLTALPPEIVQLTNLTSLDLSGNSLSALPPEIGQLSKLNWLDLTSNQLMALPPQIGELSNLTEVHLDRNQLAALPPQIGQLSNLNRLDLYSNQLAALPPQIGQLSDLTFLVLEGNQLTALPSEIGQLTNLTTLSLNDNSLSALPPEFGQLTNLTELDLSRNSLSALPLQIGQLAKLEYLHVDDNPLEKPPLELAKRGVAEIAKYFRQLEEQGVDQLFEAKLLVVGEPGAGKTTLAKKIEDPGYDLRPSEETTYGIDVIEWLFQMADGQPFRVNIWDFGGQEIYHATHQFFLTKRSLYTLVADTRKEDTDFFYWLNAVELLSDNSPLLIVKNEKQDRHREINERQLRGRFTNFRETLATNLATNRGLDKVREEIKHHIQQLPHIGSELPRTWVRVRDTLEKDERNYISLEEYLGICKRNGFGRQEDALQLSGYLHDLGVCLHFHDDPLLKRTVILTPEWGTDAVYKVVDNLEIIRNLGQFTRTNLDEIWREEKYAGMQDELLQLMMRFQLCYEIPGRQGHYIAPQLLTENQPEYEWNARDNLLLRYSYEFMPKGILTRFIVAMHRFIADQECVWKTGVVLEKDATKAEVVERYDRREVRIAIAGRHRKEWLTNVMWELDKIHESFHHLRYDKLIPCNCETCREREEPHFYRFESLRRRVSANKYEVECDVSFEMVDVLSLIDDVGVRDLGREYARGEVDREVIVELREILTTRFDDGEVKTLCFDLGVDYDSLRGEGKADKARELVDYCMRHDRIPELLEMVTRLRPDAPLLRR